MKAVLGYTDADVAAVQASMMILVGNIGSLMAAVQNNLLKGAGEEHLFGDDPDASASFGVQLSDFVMKSSAGNFSDEYCTFVAGMPDRVNPRPPASAFIATVGVIGSWISEVLASTVKDDPVKLAAMLKGWQKLLAINLELLLSSYAK